MSWETSVLSGFEGLNSFWGQVTPYLFPVLLIIFIGSLFVFIGKGVAGRVS